MKGQENFDRFVAKHPHSHRFFFDRPFLSRRTFFQLVGAGVSGFFLQGTGFGQNTGVVARGNPKLINKAKNVIFILLSGAPSHVDTFDLKVLNGTTPNSFQPETISGVLWPSGLMPKLAANLPDLVICRSVRSWALQHNLGQVWAQIERSPAAALGDIAPHFGSIIAIEKQSERRPTDTFPTFLALNANDAVGSGYLPSAYAPVRFSPQSSGFPDTTNPDGPARFENKWSLLYALDGRLRTNSPHGPEMEDMDGFYKAGRGMMFNPKVDAAFRFTTQESQKYGNSGFGNACLTAFKVLAQDSGTRVIHITFGGWDHHQNIYDPNTLPRLAAQLDGGLSSLLNDLKASGLLRETLVVMMGEFGRTPGRLTSQAGRDHYLQQFVVFAGAGVKGGRVLGVTDETGASTKEYGWSRERDFRTEDVGATIYSAMGINYTNIRYDDPFARGLEYIPYAHEDLYGPINELWAD
ncbi:MAG: DUF1501 domain-containing protein [Bryobacteraceae bacterium]|nr:DUF1501 domain-containing protein [Bryobacteraceae bacterium]MDW8378961.1 DUF1501 domain-containing protein [Bryobacterales bacterium]